MDAQPISPRREAAAIVALPAEARAAALEQIPAEFRDWVAHYVHDHEHVAPLRRRAQHEARVAMARAVLAHPTKAARRAALDAIRPGARGAVQAIAENMFRARRGRPEVTT